MKCAEVFGEHRIDTNPMLEGVAMWFRRCDPIPENCEEMAQTIL